jgi:hypothetical protein
MTANLLTNVLLKEIPKHFQARVWRQNVIAAVRGSQFIRSGRPGMADISGIINVNGAGIRLEVEVKIGRDQVGAPQRKFRDVILELGGIYLVAREQDQLIKDLAAEVARRSS